MSKLIQQPKPIVIFKRGNSLREIAQRASKLLSVGSHALQLGPEVWDLLFWTGLQFLPFWLQTVNLSQTCLLQYKTKRKNLHCNYVATNARFVWYLLRQLFFSLFQGSDVFLFLLQCCLVTCNQLLNCTCRRKNGNLGHSQTFRTVRFDLKQGLELLQSCIFLLVRFTSQGATFQSMPFMQVTF